MCATIYYLLLSTVSQFIFTFFAAATLIVRWMEKCQSFLQSQRTVNQATLQYKIQPRGAVRALVAIEQAVMDGSAHFRRRLLLKPRRSVRLRRGSVVSRQVFFFTVAPGLIPTQYFKLDSFSLNSYFLSSSVRTARRGRPWGVMC